MKKYIPVTVILLIFLVGVGVLSYPLVSSVINNIGTRSEAQANIDTFNAKSTKEIDALFAEAEEYNETLVNNVILTDPFDKDAYEKIGAHYEETFNVDGEGLIGYVEVPKINVYLPIYHGTSAEVLEKGAGHLDNTAFPIGGENTHSVISAHTAFPTETFFDYLTDMEVGDSFYIHVLNRTLKYDVDQIKVVKPDDTQDLYAVKGEDHITLLTCTPYSINTHRLLVRGKRDNDYVPEPEAKITSFTGGNGFVYFLGYKISYVTMFISILAFLLAVGGVVFFLAFNSKRKSKKRAAVAKGGDDSA